MASASEQRQAALQEAMAAFKGFDVDGDGSISRREVEQYVVKAFSPAFGGSLPAGYAEAQVEEFFTTFDANQDGKIQVEEWMSFFGKLYDAEYERQQEALEAQLEAERAARPRYARELKDIDFSYLRRELDNIRSPSGESLYAHIKRVFEHLILHNPDRALERFEEISYMIKKKMDVSEFLKMEDVRDYKPLAEQAASYTAAVQPYFALGEPDDEGNIPQPEPLAT